MYFKDIFVKRKLKRILKADSLCQEIVKMCSKV